MPGLKPAALEKISRLNRLAKKLHAEDKKTKASIAARAAAKKFGKPARKLLDNFGRNLAYYAGVVDAIGSNLGKDLRGKKILHIGSGTGVLAKHLQNRQAIAVGMDIDRIALLFSRWLANRNPVLASAKLGKRFSPRSQHLPFIDSSLDCVISDHFLFSGFRGIDNTHSRNAFAKSFRSADTLDDVFRILKPGGIAVLNACSPNLASQSIGRIKKMGFELVSFEKYYFNDGGRDLPFAMLVLRKKA